MTPKTATTNGLDSFPAAILERQPPADCEGMHRRQDQPNENRVLQESPLSAFQATITDELVPPLIPETERE